jgi:hypothetical protein
MSIRERLENLGYNRDLEVSEDEWRALRDEEHSDRRTMAFIGRIDEATFRDDRKRKSIELKDYRNRSFDSEFVAELEHFNPDKRPLSHILVDMPLWLWRNRIKNRGPKK